MGGEDGAQQECAGYKSVADEVWFPYRMGEFGRKLRLGKIEKVQVGCDADQHGLNEIECRERVQVLGLLLRVKKHGHRQGRKPETEQEVSDPLRSAGNMGDVNVEAETLRRKPQHVRRRSQTPKRTRQPLRAARGTETSEDDQSSQAELNRIGQDWAGRSGAARRNRRDVGQQKNCARA